MTTRFFPPPHGEASKLRQNQEADQQERALRQWATPERAASISARADILEASGPGDGPAVLATELANLNPGDIAAMNAVKEGMWETRANEGSKWDEEDPLENDRFDWSWNPGRLGGEALGWWQRSPGEWLGNDAPVISSAPVKGATRWFMMAADAGVDMLTDRIIRSGFDAIKEVGHADWSSPSTYMNLAKEFGIEYATGEDIGNKEFWGALGELTSGRRVNLGTGYIANSELTPEVEAAMRQGEMSGAQYAQQQFAMYEEDPAKWAQQAIWATPYSQATWYNTKVQHQALNQMDPAKMQAQVEQYGKPLTQLSQTKQEAFGGAVSGPSWTGAAPIDGRQHYSQVSAGRIGALVVSEPGTTPYHYISGGTDFAKQIFGDPLNYVGVGAVGKAADARRAIGATTEGAQRAAEAARIADDLTLLAKGDEATDLAGAFRRTEEMAGGIDDFTFDEVLEMPTKDAASLLLDSRARKTVEPQEANRWLTGEQAQPMVSALTEATTMRQVDAILSRTKGRINANLRGQLREATTEAEVIDALLPHIGEMQLSGSFRRSQGISAYRMRDAIPLIGEDLYMDQLWKGVDALSNTVIDNMFRATNQARGAMFKNTGNAPVIPGLTTRAQMRYQYGNTWVGRAFNNASNQAIRTDDIDIGYQQFERLVRNYGMEADSVYGRMDDGTILRGNSRDDIYRQMDELGLTQSVPDFKDVDRAMYNFSQVGAGHSSKAFDSVRQFMDAAAMQMELDGIDPMFIKAVTRIMDETAMDSRFTTNALGETSKYPGSGFMALADGEVTGMPTMRLITEMYQGNINIPDYSVLRRTLAEKGSIRRAINRFTTQKTTRDLQISIRGDDKGIKFVPGGSLEERAMLRYTRTAIGSIWKPMKLLRFGYIPKVVLGDEQARMTAAGLSTIWAPGRVAGRGDSPLSYIAYLMSRRRGVDITNNPIAAASEFQNAVSLKGNIYGEVGAMRSEHWTAARRGSPEYADGLANEWKQLAEDPIASKMLSPEFGDDAVTMTKQWLTEGDGQKYLNLIADKIAQQNPHLAEQLRQGGPYLDNYLQMINGRLHLKTGGDYVWVDPNTGTLMGSNDLPYAGPPLEFDTSAGGVFITRRGDGELLDGLFNGRIGEDGPKVAHLDTADYTSLRQYAQNRVDEIEAGWADGSVTEGVRFPEGVKSERSGYAHHEKKFAERTIDNLMDIIVAKPAETLNRAPAYAQFYWTRVIDSAPMMTDDVYRKTLKAAKEQGMVIDKSVARRLQRARKNAPDADSVDSINNLEAFNEYAHSYAATAVRDLLFDFAERKNFFDAISLISPFADAWLEAFTSWGRLFAQDPRMIRRPLKALQELRDDDFTEWGRDTEVFDANNGFFHMNDYGQEVFSVPLSGDFSELISKQFFDGELPEMEWETSLEGLNMIAGQYYPNAGPVLTIPASQLIPDSPEYKWLRDFVAPFGLEDDIGKALFSETVGASPTLNRFLNGITQGRFESGDQERIFEQTRGYVLRDMLTSGEVTQEDLLDPNRNQAIQREITARAQQVYFVRGIQQFLMPAAPNAPKFIADPGDEAFQSLDRTSQINAIALQDASRIYYDLKEQYDGDDESATMKFIEQYGFDPLPVLVSMTEKQYDRAVTEGGYNFEQRNPELFTQFPATSYFLRPDNPDDPFFYEAWAAQLAGEAREPKSVNDQIDEYLYRAASGRYEAAKRQAELAVNEGRWSRDRADEVLDDYKLQLMQENAEFMKNQGTYSQQRQQDLIVELREWQKSDLLTDDPTQQAVTDFMGWWDEAYRVQLDRGIGTSKTQVLPFSKTTASYGGESYNKRAAINRELLRYGDELAEDSETGYFAEVWVTVIRPTIFDYDADIAEKEAARDPQEVVDEIVRDF